MDFGPISKRDDPSKLTSVGSIMAADHMKIIIVTHNLFFLPRIQNAATPHGHIVRQADSLDRFNREYDQNDTTLVLIDLEGDSDLWSHIVEKILAGKKRRPRIIAYGPHSDTTSQKTAQETGCDTVLTKGEFSRDLVELIASSS